MSAAAEAASSFDFDGAVAEAEQASKDASEAADALELADNWAPAHSAVVYLSSAAVEMKKAVNLFKLGAQSLDVSLIEESTKHQEKATYQMGRANKAAAALTSTYGKPC